MPIFFLKISVWLLCGEQTQKGPNGLQEDQLGGYWSRSGKSPGDGKRQFGLGCYLTIRFVNGLGVPFSWQPGDILKDENFLH